MHIRRLELQGFKSFKDKTLVHFDDGITGIVGPNGCGKSNVVDAFFWVMGEQNARQLRGQSMDDLIFSGSDKSPPGSFAEVTLVLEMPGELTGPNAPAGASANPVSLPTREVQITRKLYRTGECDYFLNKTPCRLRDIQELFMDTGVGARGYSIIQQGQIAKIVQAKPEDRRTMIEEVAGIVKYKTRRKESMRKLEGTQQNLLRVADVINELEIQKRQMERQADKARKNKEWREKLQSIELRFNALKWDDHSSTVGALEQAIEAGNQEATGLATTIETTETGISQRRIELAQAAKISEEFQQKWMESGTALNNSENALKYAQKTLEDLATAIQQLETDSQEEKLLIEALVSEQQALNLEHATIDEQFSAAELSRSGLEAEAVAFKRVAEETSVKVEDARRRLFQTSSELEKAKGRAMLEASRIQELGASVQRFAIDRSERESLLASALEEITACGARVGQSRSAGESERSQLQALSHEITETNRALGEQRREIGRLSGEQARLRTTLHTLEEQKRRHEDSSKGVQAVFQRVLPQHEELKTKVLGTLADMLDVSAGMETAVEASLGRALDLIVTSDSGTHITLSDALKRENAGRAAFADASQLAAAAATEENFTAPAEHLAAIAGPLSQFVRMQAGGEAGAIALLDRLIGNAVVVRAARAAAELSRLFPERVFVTLEGEVFRGGWFMEGGDHSSVSGAHVGRNREIQELREKSQAMASELAAQQSKLSELEARLQQLEGGRRESEERLRSLQTELSQLLSEEASLHARMKENERMLTRLLQDEEKAKAEMIRLETSDKEERVQIFALETEKGALEVEAQRLGEALAAARLAWENMQHPLVDARVRVAGLAEQKSTLEKRRQQNQMALGQHQNRIEHMLESARKRQAEAEETAARIESLQGEIVALRTNLVESEQTYRSAKERFDLLNAEVEEKRSLAHDIATKARAVNEQLMEKRLEHQKLASERENLAQNTFEVYGIQLGEYALQPETMEQVQLLRDAGEGTIQEIRNEVLLLKERIRKLGDVNPSAVEEYDAIVERYNLLSAQKADLEKAMADLQNTVDRINHVSKERFERAFHEVNRHFQKVFPVIFGGGHAHLTLTNPEDMLETGVDITAQPPGKKAQNINLLSGGEKTLTAISLLFSIFLVKPSPFCLLDEVDAPLDDANIGRFNALLREMSKNSQFIIITHNKRTMELNDKLYGVTMEDAGVSKMVSIQLSAS